MSLGSKEAWYQELLSSCQGRVIAAPSEVNPKIVVAMFSVWHELLSRVLLQNCNENKGGKAKGLQLGGNKIIVRDMIRCGLLSCQATKLWWAENFTIST